MSATAVPLRPIAKGSLARLWVAILLVLLAAAVLAWAGLRKADGGASAFLSANSGEEGVVTTDSGLQYKVVKQGTGNSPTADDIALVSYRGTLIDGTVFDENPQAAMPVGAVVPGFSEALQMMKPGGEYKLWIPPELAYGDQVPEGSQIPKNAVLVFDVTLLDFKTRAEVERMQAEMQRMQAQGMGEGGAPAAP